MSVTLEKYCETTKSRFADALAVALQKAVFILADEVTLEKVDDGVRAYVDVMHTIYKTDIELIITIFDGLYWQIGTSCSRCTYRVIFYLTPDWL